MATVKELHDLFLADCAEKRSAATVIHYRKRLKPFLEQFGDRTFAELKPIEVMAYINRVNRFAADHKKAGQLKANATRASNAVVLQLLQAFAKTVKDISDDVLPRLEIPIGREREDLPTEAEVRQILNRANPAFSSIYRALRQTGARPGELVAATFSDWHQADNEIVLENHKTAGKTGSKRKIVVGKKFLSILTTATSGRTEGRLFLNSHGAPWTVDALSKTFSRVRDAAGVRSSIVLYCTRHEHATKLCKEKGIDAACAALGHKSINTTKRYDHKEQKTLQDNQDLMADPTAIDDTPGFISREMNEPARRGPVTP